jgi:MOSC domain-containing protein YiiM
VTQAEARLVAMFEGKVTGIFIGPVKGKPMIGVEDVRAVAGRGLEGDRYFDRAGTFSKRDPESREITLIEQEAVDAAQRSYDVEVDPAETRRNVLTEGVPLNHLVDEEFTVGEVRLRGLKLCEPCGHLERVTAKGVREPLIHRGGLRAQILTDGVIRVGDPVRSSSGS